jgi:hypothetical protein
METTGKMLLSYTRPGQPVNSRSFTATALGDVRLGPEEVPADDPLTSVTPTVEKSPVMTQPPPQVSPAAHYRPVGRGQRRQRRVTIRDGSKVVVGGYSSVTALTFGARDSADEQAAGIGGEPM